MESVPTRLLLPYARLRWSGKAASGVLGCHPKKARGLVDTAMRRVALLMLSDPADTHADLSTWIDLVRAETLANGIEFEERIKALAAASEPRASKPAAGR